MGYFVKITEFPSLDYKFGAFPDKWLQKENQNQLFMKIRFGLYPLSTFIVFLTIFTFAACDTRKKKKQNNELNQLTLEASTLKASADSSWKSMIAEDDQKIKYLSRLLEEVEYTKAFDPQAVQQLKEQIAQLKKDRYQQEEITNIHKVDAYDSLEQGVIYAVINYSKENPKFDHYPAMAELIQGIQDLHDQVLSQRINYDKAAFAYNEFLEANEPLEGQPFPTFIQE
ncbi:hypothetical protein PEDI_22910 [Persicobacter diffluens]|uniref:LemA family protein n=2 Tax=Persicobacter diffluens TaxID=981 RepID=A0AAN4VX57_9BACT|nr:hypothetical protein PEDI_22910 [Persicobacter diffluens]